MKTVCDIKLGETEVYAIRKDRIKKFIITGRAEHLAWNFVEEAYTPVTFLYGRNEEIESFSFVVNKHPSYQYSLHLDEDVFFTADEARKELESRKEQEQTVIIGADINDFAKKKKKRSIRA